jgi:hypothetical protein
VLSDGTRGSTYGRRSLHRTSVLADHSVEWIGEHAPRAVIQAAHALKVAGLPQILFYEAHVSLVVQPMPDGYRLARKATVREGDDRGSANRLILTAARHALAINPARNSTKSARPPPCYSGHIIPGTTTSRRRLAGQ